MAYPSFLNQCGVAAADSQVADGADELKDTPLLSSFPACTQRALSNTIWRIMDWGHQAPFYVLFPLFFGRATNLPRVNMATGCLVVTTVTTRGHNCHYGHYPRVVTVVTVVTRAGGLAVYLSKLIVAVDGCYCIIASKG